MFPLKIWTTIFLSGLAGLAWPAARIVSLKGDVQIRRGLDESWQRAAASARLEDIDSILSGETGEVMLQMEDGRTFRMGPNTILDIGDLRTITERELFLFLMAEKVQKLKMPDRGTPIRIQNVSTVRAEEKKPADAPTSPVANTTWKQETNTALAMSDQAYHPNAVIKIYQILDKYTTGIEKDRLYFYLGKTFEAMNEKGRALEAYQAALNHAGSDSDSAMVDETNRAIQRLK